MLGFGDAWILAVFLLCLGSTLLCLAWGFWRWNSNDDDSDAPQETIQHWAAEEDRVESEL